MRVRPSASVAPALTRLSIVFADPIRLKIVRELYMREMSPTRFYEEFGGASVSRIRRHFRTLTAHGWLRLVRKESGGRRGAPEHFYRAPEPAIFDLETWSQLPRSIRSAFSWRTFEQLVERVEEALEAGTFDQRSDRHLSWASIVLDQRGWEQLIAAADRLFESLFEEQADAKLRMAKSEESPILVTEALNIFESPMCQLGADEQLSISDLKSLTIDPVMWTDSPVPFSTRLAKVFADPLNMKIVTELNIREMSPSQLRGRLGGLPLPNIDRRVKMLTDIGWLIKVDEKTGGRRRGATECFYRATGPAVFDTDSWSDVPSSVKTSYSWRTFQQLAEKIVEAIEAGTFDARPERHMSWTPILLDRRGWEQVIAAIDALFESLSEYQLEAKIRIGRSGEKPFMATIALTTFESPETPDQALAHREAAAQKVKRLNP